MFSLFRNTAKRERDDSGKDLRRGKHHPQSKSEESRSITYADCHPDKSHAPAVQSDLSNESYGTRLPHVEEPPEGKVYQNKVYQNTVISGDWACPGSRNKYNRG